MTGLKRFRHQGLMICQSSSKGWWWGPFEFETKGLITITTTEPNHKPSTNPPKTPPPLQQTPHNLLYSNRRITQPHPNALSPIDKTAPPIIKTNTILHPSTTTATILPHSHHHTSPHDHKPPHPTPTPTSPFPISKSSQNRHQINKIISKTSPKPPAPSDSHPSHTAFTSPNVAKTLNGHNR
jgi:hypothetical protein